MSAPQPHPRRAARARYLGSASATILDLLQRGMERKVFEAVLLPMRVPAGDGYAHILVRDRELLASGTPLPPIMTASGGQVLTSLTRRGPSDLRVAVVMRPCEMRAVLELVKLGQVDLRNLTLISMDCPGALPLPDFSLHPEGELAKFGGAERDWEERDVRRICQICEHASNVHGDLHLGLRGHRDGTVPWICGSPRGEEMLSALGMELGEDLSAWQNESLQATASRQERRKAWRAEFGSRVQGPENLLDTLSACINCHNCMRVCPVCYCRVCYFDSDRMRHRSSDYLDQASAKGALRFPPDMLLFHLGRMAHMSLTCVSCGACEDACPAAIPIAQVFSLVAERVQRAFQYLPGRSVSDALPLTVYREEELEGDRDG